MEQKHAGLPWQIVAHYGIDRKIVCGIAQMNGETIIEDVAHFIRPRNAEFIVRATNNHYKLLEVLKDVISELRLFNPESVYLDEADLTIKQAEGK